MRWVAIVAAIVALALPAAAQADGIYTTCYSNPTCTDQLGAIHSTMPHVDRVLNYGAQELSLGERRAYQGFASSLGQKLIWPIPGDWPCNGPATPNVADRVDSESSWASTWGFYIGEEGAAAPCAATIANHTNLPRLYVDGPRDSGRIDWGDIARFDTYKTKAERLGVECYPIKSSGLFDPSTCDDELRFVRQQVVDDSPTDAASAVIGVPQAFSWSDNACDSGFCDGVTGLQGPYPSRADQCAMRASMDPPSTSLIWFDYYFMVSPWTVNDQHGAVSGHAPVNARARLDGVIADPGC